MKIFELLLEYRRDVTQQKLAKELDAIAKTANTTPDNVLTQVEAIDPTKNKQYVLWLIKQLAQNQFELTDADTVHKMLNGFDKLKGRLPQHQRDVGQLDYRTLAGIVNNAHHAELGTTGAVSSQTFPVVPDSKVLYNGPLGQLSIPETEAASCELGRGTKWCTAANKDNKFEDYNEMGPLYVWRDKNGEKYQIHFDAREVTDSSNRRLTNTEILQLRKHPILSKLFAKEESSMLSQGDSMPLARYAAYMIKGRWPEAEEMIAKESRAAFSYARTVLKQRWPEAEPVIMKEPMVAVDYAAEIIRGRWPEAEANILKSPIAAADYAILVLKAPWPEAESAIRRDRDAWARYSHYF